MSEHETARRLRAAFDTEFVPPRPGFEARMRAAVEPRRGKRDLRWTREVLAAALVVVLVGGLILGARFLHDLNTSSPFSNQAELNALEHRALLFQAVAPASSCPVTPITAHDAGLAIGTGPVYIISNDAPMTTNWGFWAVYKFAYAEREPGLVLVRARDLRTNTVIVFAQNPLGPSAITAWGPVLGHDQLAGGAAAMHSEAVFQDARHTAPIGTQNEIPPLTVAIGDQGRASSCVGIQFDGPDFTENVVIRLSGSGLQPS